MFDGLAAVSAGSVADSEVSSLERIVAVFAQEFGRTENTALIPGAEEPYYQPAKSAASTHKLFSRLDYPASALHEAAHWCLAGARRRQLADFGYWYAADGRSRDQQREFQRVEVKPQAIEWAFSRAVGLRFQVSIDNLAGEALDPFGFQLAVWQQARRYALDGLPLRAERFARALSEEFATGDAYRAPQSLAALTRGVSGGLN